MDIRQREPLVPVETTEPSRSIPPARLSRRTLAKGAAAAAAASSAFAVPNLNFRVGAQDSVELRWSMWSASDAERAVWDELAADVATATGNGITVTLETASFADYWDRLQTQLAGGTQADIIAMQSLRMPVFAVRDALRPLQPFIDADPGVNVDDFFPAIRDGLSFDGQLYAFAYDLGPIILYYNLDRFEAAGVAPPSPETPMTWDEFREKATALTNAEANQHGFVMQPGFTGTIPWIWSNGGDYLNEDASATPIDEEGATGAFQFLLDMIRDGTMAPVTDLANTNFALEQFYSGNIGMHQDGPWQFVNIRNNSSFRWDIAPLPAGPAGSTTWVAGSGFGISAAIDDERAQAAWEALKVITSQASLEKTAAAGRGYPGRQSAVPAFIDPANPPENVVTVERILTNEIANTRFLRTTTTWQETEVMLTQEFNPFFLGETEVADIVSAVKPEMDDLLEDHQELVNG